ncbi:hypothetical protein [Azospirillum doebereinerae]
MLPVLTFASGLIAGALGVQLLKKAKLPAGAGAAGRLDKAQTSLRQAAACGLAAVETSSASLRAKLTPAEPIADAPLAEPVPVEEAPAAGPATGRERDA